MMLSLGGVRPMPSPQKPDALVPLVQTSFIEDNGAISPDGRWLAYESDTSGEFQIYVRPFPDASKAQWRVSTAGGSQPLWSRSGGELFYRAPDGAVMSVSVKSGATWNSGTPVQIVGPAYYVAGRQGAPFRSYDVAPDGQRFLMIKESTSENQTTAMPPIIVVQNWHEELKRLVPAP
jgi:serine/threonine-protein kinase